MKGVKEITGQLLTGAVIEDVLHADSQYLSTARESPHRASFTILMLLPDTFLRNDPDTVLLHNPGKCHG